MNEQQDKELRELVHMIQNADTTYDAIQFITADRERVALEARIDELKQLTEFEVATIGIINGRHHRSYCDRITELKAQQEEVK